MFIAVFTLARHFFLSWTTCHQFTLPCILNLDPDNVLPSILRLPSGLLPSAFHTRTLYVLLLSPTSATFSAHLILLVIFGEGYKWWSSSSHSFLQSALSTLFSHTPSTCSSPNVTDDISCGCRTTGSCFHFVTVQESCIFKKKTFCTKIHFKTFTYQNKLISTPTCFGLIRPSSGSCRA